MWIRARVLFVDAALLFGWITFGAGIHCFAEAWEPINTSVLLRMIRDNAVHEAWKLSD